VISSVVGLVANARDGTLTIFDPLTNEIKRTVRVGDRPSGIVAVAEPKNVVYVTNAGSNDVSMIDPVAMTVIRTIPAGNAPSAIAGTFDSHVYAANAGGNGVSALSVLTNAVDATLGAGSAPAAISLGGLFWPAPRCTGLTC
jgi:YVTN family beta-propeller protein